jgi:signal transduction histidine kinase
MVVRLFISFLTWAIAAAIVLGQPLPQEAEFNRFSTKDGLPDNNITCLLQDQQGLLWVGTEAGLSCFDGVHFINYFKGTNPDLALPSNRIVRLLMLPSGNMAVATQFGLSLLDPVRRTFRSVQVPFEPGMEYMQNAIGTLVLTDRGEVVIGNNAGIAVFDQGLNLLYQYSHFKKEDLEKQRMGFAQNLTPMSGGDVLIKGWNGLWRYHSARQTVDRQDAKAFGEAKWEHITWADRKDFSLTHHYFPDTLFAHDLHTGRVGITALSEEIKHEIHWRSTLHFVNDTLLGFTGHTVGFRTATCDPKTLLLRFSSKRIFDKVHINHFLFDQEGRWWLASENGLYGQSFSKKRFRFVDLPLKVDKDGTPQSIMGMTRANDRFYIVQRTRILVCDESLHLEKAIDMPKELGQIEGVAHWQANLLDLWTTTGWRRLRLDKGSKPWKWELTGPAFSVSNQKMTRRGEIWTGYYGRVLHYNPANGQQSLFEGSKEEGGFPLQEAWDIVETDSSYLWVSAPSGFTRWNPFSQRFDRRFLRVPGTEGQEGYYSALVGTGGEDLLFSMWNNGLWVWSGGEEPARKLYLGEAASEIVLEIIPDTKPKHLWLLLKSGLGYLDLARYKCWFSSYSDGLPDATTLTNFYLDTLTDSIYLCYQNGIAVASRSAFGFSEREAPIFITEVRQPATGRLFSDDTDLLLSQPGNDLVISFASPDFERGQLMRYAYRLNGGAWQNLGGSKSVRLVNLAHGAYRFEVISISPDGILSQPATLSFGVRPRFFQTWWFLTVMAAAALLAVYSYFRWRLAQLRKTETMRQSIAADLHDEVGASLTSIQILTQIAADPDPARSVKALEKLPEQVRQTSASLREIVWNVNPRNEGLQLFIGHLMRHAGEMFEKMGILYTLHADEFGPDDYLDPAARQHLARIFKEVLNNLAKHSESSRASIVFKNERKTITLIVRDNGKGFDPDTVRRGDGLDNLQQRTRAAGGQLRLRSDLGDGTEIILNLPFLSKKRWWRLWTK